ncbi:MAG: ATP-binding cassette domain-containing protein [Oscillospiraceae bacterium]
MIKVKNLVKDYEIVKREHIFSKKNIQTVNAIKNIDFTINDGEAVGLIGLNGAGKTTLIKMLTGILTPTNGEIEINGFIPRKRNKEYLSQIGVFMGQRSSLFYDIDLKYSFEYNKEIYKISDEEYARVIDELDGVMGIKALMDTPVRKLSFGQRIKAQMACSILHMPKIVFLDEPTIGLDILVKENIVDFINFLNKKYGTTFLLTSHELDTIEKCCERIIVLKNGKIIYDGKIDAFNDNEDYRKIAVNKKVYQENKFDFENVVETDTNMEFIINIKENDYSEIFSHLIFTDFTIEKLSLEDIIKKMEKNQNEIIK